MLDALAQTVLAQSGDYVPAALAKDLAHSVLTIPDEGYNGWSNYPTWNVNLWLSNDEGLYRHTLDIARNTPPQKPLTEARYAVGNAIKHFVRDDLAGDILDRPSFTSDLLDYALGGVDWYEIADSWLEENR